MKRSVLAGLMITAALATAPVFAADSDLCKVNLQKLNDAKASTASMSESAKGELDTAISQANAEKAAGDNQKCVATAEMALQKIMNMGKGSGGAGSGQ